MIFILIGPSASGKDTIFRKLIRDKNLDLKRIITYTTRPMRDHEQNGREYFFVSESEFETLRSSVIESRTYQTANGPWTYFTADDGQIKLYDNNYLVIGTPDVCKSYLSYFEQKYVCPLLIYVKNGERLQRALDREKHQKKPDYKELCRRFLADCEDFKSENLPKPLHMFINHDADKCASEIKNYILRTISR